MLNKYIKNSGLTKTIISNNSRNHIEEIKWDTDYDGNRANFFLKTNNDGRKNKYHYTLNNADLAELLNVDSVNVPIYKRLKQDFNFRKPIIQIKPKIYRIELPEMSEMSETPESFLTDTDTDTDTSNFLSSPLSNEEFIIPITLEQMSRPYERYTFTPRKRNLTLKRYKKKRIIKRPKSYKKRKQTSI
jgi:hypothetical protein